MHCLCIFAGKQYCTVCWSARQLAIMWQQVGMLWRQQRSMYACVAAALAFCWMCYDVHLERQGDCGHVRHGFDACCTVPV